MLRTFVTISAFGVLMLGGGAARAQQPDERDARIEELEARVARLEALIGQLTDVTADSASSDAPPEPGLPSPTEPSATAVPAASDQGLPQELLPSLGKIGASVALLAGVHSGPFRSNGGSYLGGSVELPLLAAPGGRLHYEFSAGLGRSDTPLRVTSNVAQVANLAVLASTRPDGGPANVEAALTGRAPAPYPVEYDTTSRLQVLRVVPFGLKYVGTGLDRYRLRPYAAAGLVLSVAISSQQTSPSTPAPFGGALIAGQLAAATELAGRGVPSGQGGIDIGLETGGGIEWRARRGLSLGLDVRFNRLTNGHSFTTAATRAGMHF
ncbi:MAG: hypothetical protein ABW221_24405 [Vicinamibacteria bacterium]